MADRPNISSKTSASVERTRKRTLREEQVRARREREEKEIAAAADTRDSAPTDMFENADETAGPDDSQKIQKAARRPAQRQPGFQPFTEAPEPETETPRRADEDQSQFSGESPADRASQLRQAQQLARTSGQAEEAGQTLRQAVQTAKAGARIARATAAVSQAVSSTIAALVATWEIWLPVVIILLLIGLFIVGIVILAAAACEGQTGTLLDALPDGIRNTFVQLVTRLQCPS